jgi:hypothetical protein
VEDASGLITPFGESPPAPEPEQKDFPPEEGDFGKIVHPRGVTLHEGSPANRIAWPAGESVTLEGHTYSIVVDRTNGDEASRQIWLPGTDGHQGYNGRWGVRVARDPNLRRSGMKFPPFVEMFLVALTNHF